MANINTPVFRVSYPHVFTPQTNDLNGKSEFSLVALFPRDADLSVLKAAAQAALVKKFGADKAKWPKNLRSPFRDQVDKKREDGTMPDGYDEGAIFLTLRADASKHRPQVVDSNVQKIIDPTEFYGGCWAIASVNAYAYDQSGNRGVSFGLGNLQKIREGESFGGSTKAEDDFAPVPGGAAAGESAESLFD